MPGRIAAYAPAGDWETTKLVGRDGSIVRLCRLRLAVLLGAPENRRWPIAPSDQRTRRGRREGTLTLKTVFETEEGSTELVDLVPPRDGNPEMAGRTPASPVNSARASATKAASPRAGLGTNSVRSLARPEAPP